MAVLMIPEDKEPWPSLGGQVCDWIEDNLVFGPGDLKGDPARLDDDKRALIWRMYEVYPRKHKEAGRRRFKRCAVSLPKGMAKTELSAWIAAAELSPDSPVRTVEWDGDAPIGGPVRDPYIPLVAYTEEQSDELAYGALRSILSESEISELFDVGIERIVRSDGSGKAVSLAGSPNARDGARTTFQVFDETHWMTLPKLKKAHQTMIANLPKRRAADAWALEITTAPEPGAGSIAEDTMEYARQVYDGKLKDSRLFFFHRQSGDEHDLTTEEGARNAILEASGPAAAWRDIEGIVDLWRDPTTDRTYWERVWCNRLVKGGHQAFDIQQWRERATDYQPKEGAMITIGFDGAIFHDATGLVCTEVETGFQWVAGLWECPAGRDDWQCPVEDVDQVVKNLFEVYNVWRMYADPPYWQGWLSSWQGEFGDDVVIDWWTNRRKQMSYALENFDTAIKNKAITHDGDSRLERHLGNSRKREMPQKDEDGHRLWLISKERHDSPHKIDLAMCAVLSWEARTDAISSGALEDESAGVMIL